jgi:hypothetical protein
VDTCHLYHLPMMDTHRHCLSTLDPLIVLITSSPPLSRSTATPRQLDCTTLF